MAWPRSTIKGKNTLPFEHAYAAAKCKTERDREFIRKCSTPGEAKRLARQVPIREDWDDIRLGVMYELVKEKFSRHKDLRDKLLATGQFPLIEGNRWGDTFWGVCRGVGENNLGKILMRVRDELREDK